MWGRSFLEAPMCRDIKKGTLQQPQPYINDGRRRRIRRKRQGERERKRKRQNICEHICYPVWSQCLPWRSPPRLRPFRPISKLKLDLPPPPDRERPRAEGRDQAGGRSEKIIAIRRIIITNIIVRTSRRWTRRLPTTLFGRPYRPIRILDLRNRNQSLPTDRGR